MGKLKRLCADRNWLYDNTPEYIKHPEYDCIDWKLLSEWLEFEIKEAEVNYVNSEYILYGYNYKLPSIKHLVEDHIQDNTFLFLYKD